MDMNFLEVLEDFLAEGYAILVPVILILGMFLKRTPRILDWTIPWILLVVGIIGGMALNNFDISMTTDAVLQGIIATGIAVLGHQLVKQTSNRQ